MYPLPYLLTVLLLHLFRPSSHLVVTSNPQERRGELDESHYRQLAYDLLAAGKRQQDSDRKLALQPETNSLIEFGPRLELGTRSSDGKLGDAASNFTPAAELQQDVYYAGSEWCQRRCQRGQFEADQQVCASNGRLFDSICELRQFSCRHNMHLITKPLAYCSARDQHKVRVVELERRCDRAEYERMKLLLLLEFNGDLQALFNYLDSNSDRLLEAHELWPKTSGQQERLIYAQLWTNHLADCPVELARKQTYHLLRDHSKCWYQLDFAFEPHFPPNPCSLSHLILFEAPNLASLDLDSFRRAFASQLRHQLEQQLGRRQNHLSDAAGAPIRKQHSQVSVPLGTSVELSCLANLSDSRSDIAQAKCVWTRYNTSIGSLRQPHLELVGLQSSILRLQTAQLYLSGSYKCVCHLESGLPPLERNFDVQVLAEPHVEVRPEFQRSLVGSTAAFECLYDYIDTRTSQDDNQNIPSSQGDQRQYSQTSRDDEIRLNWFKIGEGSIEPVTDSNKLDVSAAGGPIAPISQRAHLSVASSRLSLDSLRHNDSGSFVCAIGAGQGDGSTVWGRTKAQLKVQARPDELADEQGAASIGSYLWVFHENGISVYKLPRDDGQEMELAREITGHSQVDAEVDGNWNQLTLCGGLNPDQVVICEWSDNALHLDVDLPNGRRPVGRHYIYVGQPNLNRVVVLDGEAMEIVAIINTEPQPRKLFLYKPNKVHLSKWVRRRLSPALNMRWLKAIGSHAHPLELSLNTNFVDHMTRPDDDSGQRKARGRRSSGPQVAPSHLLQLDIWLLCYGQPLVLDPERASNDAPDELTSFFLSRSSGSSVNESVQESVVPFTPHLGGAWSSPASIGASSSPTPTWPNNKESRLRNRKSVHIIQSTFFPSSKPGASHLHNTQAAHQGDLESELDRQQKSNANMSALEHFKRFTVLTSHHILAGPKAASTYFSLAPFDLVQDLVVPARPRAFTHDPRFQLHHAYVSHYGERRLFRVSMDEYRYQREIDLQDCDPLSLLSSVQGLLVVQCRAPITHQLTGQLVLDQLTSAQLQFNANIRAQESFISPDNRYLLSIYTNYSTYPANQKRSSLIYVQTVSVSGLKFQYQIKSTLEIEQCAFVWRDGYYAAILVSSNHQEEQSELLSLRLADSRLELLARVPGTISQSRRKDQLLVADELRLAALATNRGTFVVDLEDNRVSQSLRHHQSPPTMLWV